jgi:hypothetical protein
MPEIAFRVVAVGVGATLAMDVWALVLRHVYGVSGLDYRMVGRWLGHMARGRFGHDAIGRSAPVPAEAAIGWAAHYAIGVVFAVGLVSVAGTGWLQAPTLAPALITGLVTVAAPFLILQPALGLGVAASRTPAPGTARLRSLITHLVFGLGLYITAHLMAAL